jgi:hypothetical protein
MATALVALTILGVPGGATAQSDTVTVSQALGFLVTTLAVDTGDAARDRAAAEATNRTLSRALLSALATLPVTSSSGAFTYRFNPALGTVERTNETFGPFFVERATSGGEGRASFSMSWQHATFTRLSGMELRDGTMVTTANRFEDEVEAFDVETLRLRIRATSLTIAGSYGVTDRFDVSAAVPLVSLSLEGDRTDTYRGVQYQQATATASVTRLADVLLRGKYNLASGGWGGFSVGGDVRLPTGPEEDLVGAGQTGVRGFVVATAGTGPVSAHVTAGLSRGGISAGADIGGALAISPTPTLTLVAEMFSRRMNDVGRVRQAVASHPQIAGVQTLRLVQDEGPLTQSLAAFGLKWNVGTTWMARASMLLPINHAGLTAPIMPTLSFEYSF